jgi:hypothetical protein
MAPQPLTQEKAIEYYAELMRRVSVGAYLELEPDGSYPTGDSTLESIDDLERWAALQALEFAYNQNKQGYELVPCNPEHDTVGGYE